MGFLQDLPCQDVVLVLVLESPDVFTQGCLCPPVHMPERAVVGIHPFLEQIGPTSVCGSFFLQKYVLLVQDSIQGSQGSDISPINNIFMNAITSKGAVVWSTLAVAPLVVVVVVVVEMLLCSYTLLV